MSYHSMSLCSHSCLTSRAYERRRLSIAANPSTPYSSQQNSSRRPFNKRRRARRSAQRSASASLSADAPQIVGTFPSQHHPYVYVMHFPEGAAGVPEGLHGSFVLFVDHSGNTHSAYHPRRILTPDGYWDVMACIPALCEGKEQRPVAICGLGGGTVARVLHHYFPGVRMVGWELDDAILSAARQFFGLDALVQAGYLEAHAGDALAMGDAEQGTFSAILVDMFCHNDIVPQLEQVATWQNFQHRLASGGRIMANLGCFDRGQTALAAMSEVFGSENVQVKYIGEPTLRHGAILALTGPAISHAQWQALPPDLAFCKDGWLKLRVVEGF